MKKQISIYTLLLILIAATSIVFTSCDDLDEGTKGVIVADGFFSAEPTLEAGVLGIYARLHRATWALDQLASFSGADDLTSREGSNKWVVLEGDQFALSGGNSWTTNTWNYYYEAIHAANAFLANANPDDVDEAILKSARANAHFVRGLVYFRLATAHGDIPMPLVPELDLEMKRTKMRKVMDQVIADLEYATVNAMNDRDTDPTVHDGHTSKTAAKAFLAKTYMQLTGWPYNETDKWQNVKDLTQEIIDAGVYSLMDDYAKNFQDPHQINKEIIFAHMCYRGSIKANQSRYYGLKWGGWMDAYMEWNYYRNFPAGYRKNFSTAADASNPHFVTFEHPVVTKFTYATEKGKPEFQHTWQSSNDIPAMRYAEVLLMNAEANANLGNLPAALDALNKVKRRANGMGALNQAQFDTIATADFWMTPDAAIDFASADQQAIIDEIVKERAYEFLGETGGNRWLDLVRLDKVAEANAHRLPGNANYVQGEEVELIGDPSDKSLWWTPIPSTETVLNPNLLLPAE